MLFDFIHLPVSYLSNAALPFRERFARVPSVYKHTRHEIALNHWSTGTALQWYMIAGTTPKPHLRSHPFCHIIYIIRSDTNFLTSSPKSAPSKIKTQRNGITCMQLTSPKMPLSKTIHDQLRPLPRSSSRAVIYAFSNKQTQIPVHQSYYDLHL